MLCNYKCRLPHDCKQLQLKDSDCLSPVFRTQCVSHDEFMFGIRATRSEMKITSSLGRIANYIPNAGSRGTNLIAVNAYKNESHCDNIVFAIGDVIIPSRAFAVSEFQRLDVDKSQLQSPNFKIISKPFSKFLRRTLLSPHIVPSTKPWSDTIDDIDATIQHYKSMFYSKPDYDIYRAYVCSMFEPYKRKHNPAESIIDEYLKSVRVKTVGEDMFLKQTEKVNETVYEDMSNNENQLEELYSQLFNKYPPQKKENADDYLVENLDGNVFNVQQQSDFQTHYNRFRGKSVVSGQCLTLLSAFDLPIKEYGDKVKFRYSQNKPNTKLDIDRGFVATANIVDGEELVLETLPFPLPSSEKFKDFITHYAFYMLKFQMTNIENSEKNDLPRAIEYHRKEPQNSYEIRYVKPW